MGTKYETIQDNLCEPKQILHKENLNCIDKTEWEQTKTVWDPKQETMKWDPKQETMKWDPKHETVENN